MYFASPILESLRKNSSLKVTWPYETICPLRPSLRKCEINADGSCDRGDKGSCRQEVKIECDHNGLRFVQLSFFYRFDGRQGVGFIKCKDQTLLLLLKKGVISKEALKPTG